MGLSKRKHGNGKNINRMNRRETKRCKMNFRRIVKAARRDGRSHIREDGSEAIYLRPGIYTESIMIAKGVNLNSCYLSDDDPELWELVKDHVLELDQGSDMPLKCKKCGSKPVQKMNLLWVCPINIQVPDKYFHAG